MKEIKLTKGLIAFVDEEDFEFLSQFNWQAEHRGNTAYARGGIDCIKRRTIKAYMHRLIMKADNGQFVDHRDGNGLNNQKSNLRICSRAENNRNIVSKGKTSKYLGVDLAGRPKNRRWRAAICHNGRRKHIGHFDTEIEAAIAYNQHALLLHGEFANLNKFKEALDATNNQ